MSNFQNLDKSKKSKVLFIVGPSGSGKSYYCQLASNHSPDSVIHLDFDNEIKVRESGYVERALEKINELQSRKDGKVYLLDLGSGFQAQESILEVLKSQKDLCISLNGDPCLIYKKYMNRSKTGYNNYQNYLEIEFSDKRKELYLLSKRQIDISDYSKISEEEFLDIIKSYLH